MDSVASVNGTAVHLDVSDIDTDQIIPAVWMKRIERTGFEDGLFQKWRQDPNFVLNQPERDGATILVAGPNFGCGSSREHAPWALRDYGFKAVIAPSFADIFRTNLPNVGLIPVVLPAASTKRLLTAVEADPTAVIMIDLLTQRVTSHAAGVDETFNIDQRARYQLMNGKDIIDLTMEIDYAIRRHEEGRPGWMPSTNGAIEATFEDSGVS